MPSANVTPTYCIERWSPFFAGRPFPTTMSFTTSFLGGGPVCFGIAGETKLVPVELPFGLPFEPMALDLFSGIATPAGLLSPPDASKQAASVGLHPLLLRLAESMGRAGSLAEDRVP